jgi:hypothetical protein
MTLLPGLDRLRVRVAGGPGLQRCGCARWVPVMEAIPGNRSQLWTRRTVHELRRRQANRLPGRADQQFLNRVPAKPCPAKTIGHRSGTTEHVQRRQRTSDVESSRPGQAINVPDSSRSRRPQGVWGSNSVRELWPPSVRGRREPRHSSFLLRVEGYHDLPRSGSSAGASSSASLPSAARRAVTWSARFK